MLLATDHAGRGYVHLLYQRNDGGPAGNRRPSDANAWPTGGGLPPVGESNLRRKAIFVISIFLYITSTHQRMKKNLIKQIYSFDIKFFIYLFNFKSNNVIVEL